MLIASMGAGRRDKPGISSIFWISKQKHRKKKEIYEYSI
jgi:hypothetical protein